MALEYKVDSVPEGQEDFYKSQDDGSFILDVDLPSSEAETELSTVKVQLDEAKQKVKEFRQHNVALRQQVEKAGGTVDTSSHTDVDQAINDALAPIKQKNDELINQNRQLQHTLEEVVLSDQVKDIAIKHGVQETALPDVVSRARKVFTVKDGKPIPKDTKQSRDSDGNVLNPESWMKGLAESAAHLFTPSSGSGARRPVGGQHTSERTATQKIADGLKKL